MFQNKTMLKNKTTLLITLLAVLLALPATAADKVTRLAPLQDGDLAASELVYLDNGSMDKARPALARDAISRDDVNFTFPIAGDQALNLRPAPFAAASREYFVDVTGDDLRQGASIHVTGKNAVVRINPAPTADKASAGVDPSGLVVRSAAGSFDKGAGMSLLAGAVDMAKAGVPFAEGTTAFRLSPSVGLGEIVIQAPTLKASGRYQIHVFDVESPYVLGLRAQGMDYLHGDTLKAEARLAGSGKVLRLDDVAAYVTSPAGRAWPVNFASLEKAGAGGSYLGQLTLDAIEKQEEGIWELHVATRGVVDGHQVVRTARTVFGVHVPTAGLAGDVALTGGQAGLQADFAVSVATPGRYEVRGVLFGTDRAGNLRPVAVGHSAGWLAQDGTLGLSFDRALLDDAGVGAPFEIRDLRLMDQGRMGILHRQAVGLVID